MFALTARPGHSQTQQVLKHLCSLGDYWHVDVTTLWWTFSASLVKFSPCIPRQELLPALNVRPGVTQASQVEITRFLKGPLSVFKLQEHSCNPTFTCIDYTRTQPWIPCSSLPGAIDLDNCSLCSPGTYSTALGMCVAITLISRLQLPACTSAGSTRASFNHMNPIKGSCPVLSSYFSYSICHIRSLPRFFGSFLNFIFSHLGRVGKRVHLHKLCRWDILECIRFSTPLGLGLCRAGFYASLLSPSDDGALPF